jgi:hypothetical protein
VLDKAEPDAQQGACDLTTDGIGQRALPSAAAWTRPSQPMKPWISFAGQASQPG